MKPPEPEVRALATGWLAKAKVDLLVWRQVEFPKTHDIQRLLDLLADADPGVVSLSAGAVELTPYGVEYRYPGEYPPVRRESALWAQAVARRVYEAAAERVGAG
jgi:HEPN domain-containing protein